MRFEKKDILLLIPATLLAIAGLGPDDPWVVGPCLFLSWATFIVICVIHDGSRRTRAVVGAVITVVLFGVGYRRFNSIYQTPVVATPPAPTHTLLVRYSRTRLPISIAPNDTAYILQLNPNISEWVEEFPNRTKKIITWPPDLHTKSDAIYECDFTNNEDKVFLTAEAFFDVSFHQLQPVEASTKKNKDGTASTTFPRPGLDHVIVAYGTAGEEVKAAKDGALIKQFTRSIALPSISPGSTVRIYLINQSAFISKFTFPNRAIAVIAGNAERVPVALIRPNMNPTDSMPWFGLGPATYHWKGMPGAP